MEKLAVVVEVATKDGKREEVRMSWDKHLRPQLERADSAQELYLLCDDPTDANKLLLIELYKDPARMDANARAQWFSDYMQEVAPFLDGQPRVSMGSPRWAKGIAI
jgi:quinol monooxygenase YgiN